MPKRRRHRKKKAGGQAPQLTYKELLQAEELDRLQENARSSRINRVLTGHRCPPRDGVVRLLNMKRGGAK